MKVGLWRSSYFFTAHFVWAPISDNNTTSARWAFTPFVYARGLRTVCSTNMKKKVKAQHKPNFGEAYGFITGQKQRHIPDAFCKVKHVTFSCVFGRDGQKEQSLKCAQWRYPFGYMKQHDQLLTLADKVALKDLRQTDRPMSALPSLSGEKDKEPTTGLDCIVLDFVTRS